MKSEASNVDAYFAEQPPDRRSALEALRALVREAAPNARETMQHGMAAYDLNGLLYALASQKNHMALYVCEAEIVDAHRAQLGKLNCGKGCIRFRKLEDLPLDALRELLKEAHAKRTGAKR